MADATIHAASLLVNRGQYPLKHSCVVTYAVVVVVGLLLVRTRCSRRKGGGGVTQGSGPVVLFILVVQRCTSCGTSFG